MQTRAAEEALQRALAQARTRPAVLPSVAQLRRLPKAHLHLHLTGAARPQTIRELAERSGITLPEGLTSERSTPLDVRERRGWLRFQRLYDTARGSLRHPSDLHRIMIELCEDDRRDGSIHTEVQVDPTGYSALCGGLVMAVERLLEAREVAEAETGLPLRLVLAVNRTRNPDLALPVARLAARNVGAVVGFGLSNDERFGSAAEFERAFRIARNAGLSAVPHAGELRGAHSVRAAVEVLGAKRLGHGVRAVEDPATLALLVERQITLEVCPVSNVELGVRSKIQDLPILKLLQEGVPVALGADDPLLFGAQLGEVYARTQQAFGLDVTVLAELAAHSIRASHASPEVQAAGLSEVAGWLTHISEERG